MNKHFSVCFCGKSCASSDGDVSESLPERDQTPNVRLDAKAAAAAESEAAAGATESEDKKTVAKKKKRPEELWEDIHLQQEVIIPERGPQTGV